MVPIRKNLVDPSNYKNKCPYPMTPSRIVVHNTANDASADAEVKYMIRNAVKTSFHYAVDDIEIVQGVEENRNTYNAGDGGQGKGNREGISVEICYSKSGGERFIKAEENAAELCAEILIRYGWAIDKLTTHKSYSGKYCPHRTLDMGWERFVNMVKSHIIDKFKDVPKTHWAFRDIMYLKCLGIVNGYPGGKFMPEKTIIRSEAITMVMNTLRTAEAHFPVSTLTFKDVKPSHWAYADITYAYNCGIVSGTGSEKFQPDKKITRAESAIIIRNAIQYIMGNKEIEYTHTFTDVPKDHWAYKHVNDLYNMGIIKGYGNNTFNLDKLITRAELSTMMRNTLRYLGK